MKEGYKNRIQSVNGKHSRISGNFYLEALPPLVV